MLFSIWYAKYIIKYNKILKRLHLLNFINIYGYILDNFSSS